LIVTTDNLNFNQCNSTYATRVEVHAEYGTTSSARAKWVASAKGKKGSVALSRTGENTYAGTLTGLPTKTPVVLTVEVTGPDGTATNDPFEISHNC
jgi:hypothetical protein